MFKWSRLRSIVERCGWLLAIGCAIGAAGCFLLNIQNGMIVGGLIGLSGREHDIAVAGAAAQRWFNYAAMWQVGVAVGLFSAIKIGADLTPSQRYSIRVVVAVALSFPFTFLIGSLVLWIGRSLVHVHL